MSVSAVVDCSVVVDIEVISVFRGLHLGRHLTLPRVSDALRDYTDLVFTRWSASPEMRTRIFELGGNLTAYDATYVALAEALELPLITRDERMASSVRRWVSVQTF